MTVLKTTWVLLLGVILFSANQPSFAQISVSFQEKLLLKNPSGSGISDFIFSPDGVIGAYTEKTKDGKQVVVVENAKGAPYACVKDLRFLPDGKTIVYEAWSTEIFNTAKKFIVIGNQKGPEFDNLMPPVFSKTGNGVAYAGSTVAPTKHRVVFNGKSGEMFDEVYDLAISADGAVITYRAGVNGKEPFQCVVVNDKKGEPFGEINGLLLSADGKTVAYAATSHKQWYLVINDKKTGPFERITGPLLSPDQKCLAYAATKRNTESGESEWSVIVGDKQKGPFYDIALLTFFPSGNEVAFAAMTKNGRVIIAGNQEIPAEELALSHPLVLHPDGKTLAYVARTDEGYALMVGKQRGPVFESISDVRFSPDGSRMAYRAEKSGKPVVIIDGQAGESFDSIEKLVFSPRGNRLAYQASIGNTQYLMVDNQKKEWSPVGSDFSKLPLWSPDGRVVVYREHKLESDPYKLEYVIVGEQKSEKFEQVWPPVFISDGKKVAFGAKKSYTEPKTFKSFEEYWWKVMDVR